MKTDKELFEEVFNSLDVPDISSFDVLGFLDYCETLYGMNTEEFLIWYKENGFEGNVDMQLWYNHSIEK